MKSREKILNSLRSAQAVKTDLPTIDFGSDNQNLIEKFIEMADLSGINFLNINEKELSEVLRSFPEKKMVQSSMKEYKKEFPVLLKEKDPFKKDSIPDVFVCEAHFGVAENAAMWFDDDVLTSRILAFLPEELIIVLNKDQIVATMHQAYEKVEKKGYNYGLFIAGPSKTADIEQTLVTGAQGAKRVNIILI